MSATPAIDVTATLGDFDAGLALADIPDTVVDRARPLLFDTVGIAVRARQEAASTPSLLAGLRALGYGHGSARVIGDPDGWTPPAAALLNGALAHSLDFDDTHAAGSIHPSAPTPSARKAATSSSTSRSAHRGSPRTV